MHNLHRRMHPSSLRKRIPNRNLLWFHRRIGSFPSIGLDCDLADYQGNWQRFRVVEQDWSHDGSIPYCTFGRHAWRLSWFEGWNHLDFSNYGISSSYMEWPPRRFGNFWHLELHSMIRNQVNLKNIRFQFCQDVLQSYSWEIRQSRTLAVNHIHDLITYCVHRQFLNLRKY